MKYIILILMITIPLTLTAEADRWKISTDVTFSLSQSAYSDNWQGEEVGNINWIIKSHTRADKKLSKLFTNRNNLRMSYGQTHQQTETEAGEKKWGKPFKSTDRIDFDSILLATLNKYVDPFFSFRWESQFLYKDLEDDTYIINPMRFTESAGVARDIIDIENHRLSSRLGAAFRQKFNRALEDDELLVDGGIEFISDYHRRFVQRGINFDSKLILYQALYYSDEDDDDEDDWKALDITWENTITTRLFSIVNMVFNFDFIYDKQEHRKGQFRQHLGIGLSWQL